MGWRFRCCYAWRVSWRARGAVALIPFQYLERVQKSGRSDPREDSQENHTQPGSLVADKKEMWACVRGRVGDLQS